LDVGAVRSSRSTIRASRKVPGSDARRWLQANAAVCELPFGETPCCPKLER